MGIGGDQLIRRVDQFLKSRGFAGAATSGTVPGASATMGAVPASSATMGTVPGAQVTGTIPSTPPEPPADFVCEDDVRQAMRTNRRIAVTERTIITPAARDLGESHRVFETPGVTRQ
jgi:hypothetical protein